MWNLGFATSASLLRHPKDTPVWPESDDGISVPPLRDALRAGDLYDTLLSSACRPCFDEVCKKACGLLEFPSRFSNNGLMPGGPGSPEPQRLLLAEVVPLRLMLSTAGG